MSSAPSSSSASRGVGTWLALGACAVLLAGVGALLRAYNADQAAASATATPAEAATAGRKKKKSTRGSTDVLATSTEPLDDVGMAAAIKRAIELRSSGTGRPNQALEARIWRSIRLLDGESTANVSSTFTRPTRTDIAQWIVTYHSLAPAAGISGAPEGSADPLAERRAADYEIAWHLLDSVAAEIRAMPADAVQEEDTVMRKASEVCQLDLAHKQRRSDRLLQMYDLVRARTDPLHPEGYSEEEFFTLWMLSPLVGRWADFARWADFMHDKGQELEEFHHLAIQRADLTDYQQMYAMVKEVREKANAQPQGEDAATAAASAMWAEPAADGLDWSQWDVVASSWSVVSSGGTDSEAVSAFLKGKEPASEWRVLPPGINTLRQMGAAARITSVVAPSLPVVGPCLRGRPEEGKADWFTAAGSVLFRDFKHDLCRLNEKFIDFTRVAEEDKIKSIIAAKKPFEAEGGEKSDAADSASALAAAAAAEAGADASAEAAFPPGGAEVTPAASEDAAEEAKPTEPAAAAESDAAAASAAAASESSASAAAPAPASSSSPAGVSEWGPSYQLWRGRYFFEQVPVSSSKPHKVVPDAEPFVRVEYDVFLKLQRNTSQPNVI